MNCFTLGAGEVSSALYSCLTRYLLAIVNGHIGWFWCRLVVGEGTRRVNDLADEYSMLSELFQVSSLCSRVILTGSCRASVTSFSFEWKWRKHWRSRRGRVTVPLNAVASSLAASEITASSRGVPKSQVGICLQSLSRVHYLSLQSTSKTSSNRLPFPDSMPLICTAMCVISTLNDDDNSCTMLTEAMHHSTLVICAP